MNSDIYRSEDREREKIEKPHVLYRETYGVSHMGNYFPDQIIVHFIKISNYSL